MSDLRPVANAPQPLTAENFKFVAALVAAESAIQLETGKEYLVETRLAPLAVRHGQASVNGFIDVMRAGAPNRRQLETQVVEALTTNETLFFRDAHPFEAIRKEILPRLIAARRSVRKLSIWSAACSTGQEPYSIAMMLADHFPALNDWEVRILGTDLSTAALDRARRGRYQQIEVNRGLPAPLLIKHFRQEGTEWQLSDFIRGKVDFRDMNLVKPWPILPRFDLVFLRNVMIYFAPDTRRDILNRLRGVLAPDGYFLLGGAESALSLDLRLSETVIDRAVFRQFLP